MAEHGEAGAPCGGERHRCQRALTDAVPAAPRCHSRASKPDHPPDWSDFGAGEGNRTLVVSLEGFCSTIELHPLGARAMPSAALARQQMGPRLTGGNGLAYQRAKMTH